MFAYSLLDLIMMQIYNKNFPILVIWSSLIIQFEKFLNYHRIFYQLILIDFIIQAMVIGIVNGIIRYWILLLKK